MNNEQHNAPSVTPCTGIEAPKASAVSPSVVMYWDGGERAITAREKAVIEEHRASCFSIPLVPATPSSRWAAEGGSDPHGSRYDCERAALALGNFTDDELANAVYLHGNTQGVHLDPAKGGAIMSEVYLMAAKDRIRWLSRALNAALAASVPRLAFDPAYNAHGINLTACQLHEALMMAGSPELALPFEDRSQVRIFRNEHGHSGAGLYCECVDAEEHGCILLDGTSASLIEPEPDSCEATPPLMLKGIGKINGDGWKDTTAIGEVVYVWPDELPRPHAPGQYLRVGNQCGWTASTDQYDFQPATAEEVRSAFDALAKQAWDAAAALDHLKAEAAGRMCGAGQRAPEVDRG